MQSKAIRTVGVGAVFCVASGLATQAEDVPPLVLAQDGVTKYRIIIGPEADYGEEMAAQELALFLKEMTGAEFPIETDDALAADFEIVLGDTRRKGKGDFPEDLRTDRWEGFTLLREGAKLYIRGNIPRATLFGVYDFLDVELGVRFLTAEVTHVPRQPTLRVAMESRVFAPRIERRTIWESLGGPSMLRNRMNGHAFYLIDPKLGGVKWVGPKTHTFSSLVPAEEYFDVHPEYFAEIEGQRRREYDGLYTQLCLTNPEVVRVAMEKIREWLGHRDNRDTQIYAHLQGGYNPDVEAADFG